MVSQQEQDIIDWQYIFGETPQVKLAKSHMFTTRNWAWRAFIYPYHNCQSPLISKPTC